MHATCHHEAAGQRRGRTCEHPPSAYHLPRHFGALQHTILKNGDDIDVVAAAEDGYARCSWIVADIHRSGNRSVTGWLPASDAREYNVGRGTLRESLRFLELQGVISLKPVPVAAPSMSSRRQQPGHLPHAPVAVRKRTVPNHR